MNARKPILLLASLAAGLALSDIAGAADRSDGNPPPLPSGRIAGTIDLHADGRVVRRPQRQQVIDRGAPGLPAAGSPADHADTPASGPIGRTIRTSAP